MHACEECGGKQKFSGSSPARMGVHAGWDGAPWAGGAAGQLGAAGLQSSTYKLGALGLRDERRRPISKNLTGVGCSVHACAKSAMLAWLERMPVCLTPCSDIRAGGVTVYRCEAAKLPRHFPGSPWSCARDPSQLGASDPMVYMAASAEQEVWTGLTFEGL